MKNEPANIASQMTLKAAVNYLPDNNLSEEECPKNASNKNLKKEPKWRISL